MTKKEKRYIKELGQLYVQTSEYNHLSCDGECSPKYKPVDVLEYIERRKHEEDLNTYIKDWKVGEYSKFRTYAGCGCNVRRSYVC